MHACMIAWLHAWLTITLKLVDFSLRPCMFSGCTWMRLGMRLLIPNSQNLTLLVEDLGMRLDWDWILVWKSSFDLLLVHQHDLEEVLKLQHRVRVLERSLENETKISHDLYTEVCQKTYSCEQLGGCLLYCIWCVRNSVAVRSTVKHSTVLGHSLVPRPPVHKATIMWGSGYETLGTSLHKTWKKCTILFSEAHCKQLESRVEKLVDLQDVEDELQHCRESLAAAERSLARWVHLITRTSHTSLHGVLISCSTNTWVLQEDEHW